MEKPMFFSKEEFIKRTNIDISINELDEVLDIYNRMMDYLSMSVKDTLQNRFIFLENDNYLNSIYYDIFILILNLKKNNLLKYLDYAFISGYIGYSGGMIVLHNFKRILQDVLILHEKYKDNFKYELFYKGKKIIEDAVDDHLNDINACKDISDEYKNLINLFAKIHKICNFEIGTKLDKYYIKGYKVYLDDYVGCIFYYFLFNDILINDLGKAYKFLNQIYNNIIETIDRINLVGIKYYKDMYYHIDLCYKNFDYKVKVIE